MTSSTRRVSSNFIKIYKLKSTPAEFYPRFFVDRGRVGATSGRRTRR